MIAAIAVAVVALFITGLWSWWDYHRRQEIEIEATRARHPSGRRRCACGDPRMPGYRHEVDRCQPDREAVW